MKKDIENRINICFKEYDIRCLYEKELDEEIAYRTARALVSHFKYKDVFIGMDMRYSSKSLVEAFIKGIREQGANAIFIGMVDTPLIYFASGYYKKAGAMITASHNPLEFNGIKLTRPNAEPIGKDTGLKKIKQLVLKNNFKNSRKVGKLIKKSLFKEYKKHIFSVVNKKNLKQIKVVVDAGNGMAGKLIPIMCKNMPIKLIPLNFRMGKTHPLHKSNPAVFKNLRDLQKKVKKSKADLGIAFDSDMDRVFFVDEKGKILNSSLSANLIIKNYIGKKKKTNIIYSLTCSKSVKETVKQYNGNPIRGKVGHSYLKKTMRKKNAVFAVERSGHYYYSNNYYADSAIITSLIMCEILSNSPIPLSKLRKEFDKYSKVEEKSIKDVHAQEVAKKIEKKYKALKPKKIDKFDGTTIEFKDFWFNIRASKTEALLRINLEANTKEIMKREYKKLMKNIKECKKCVVRKRV
jgi:phosphomannomutase